MLERLVSDTKKEMRLLSHLTSHADWKHHRPQVKSVETSIFWGRIMWRVLGSYINLSVWLTWRGEAVVASLFWGAHLQRDVSARDAITIPWKSPRCLDPTSCSWLTLPPCIDAPRFGISCLNEVSVSFL